MANPRDQWEDGRCAVLTNLAFASLLIGVVMAAPGGTSGCNAAWSGDCSAETSLASIEVSASQTNPGNRGGGSSGGGGSGGGGGAQPYYSEPVIGGGSAGGGGSAPRQLTPLEQTERMCRGVYENMGTTVDACVAANASAWAPGDAPPADDDADPAPDEGGYVIPPVTLTDVATLAPPAGTTLTEPDGVGVVGLPMNFIAPGQASTASGELFGFPVTARFTPTEYVFDYGDGTVRVLGTPGRTWAALGQAQLTATDTSHTYSERGTYTAAITTRYAAEVNFGGGWIPVAGLLELTADPIEITIYESRTALVELTCTEDPDGPGC